MNSSAVQALLWVDDEWDTHSVLLLRVEGIEVECAASMGAALAMLDARQYAGIVLDERLPDGSGLSVLTRLRSSGLQTPVMLLTGFGTIESAVTAMRLGAVDYRQKPLIGEEWIDSVRALLARASPPSPVLPSSDAVATSRKAPGNAAPVAPHPVRLPMLLQLAQTLVNAATDLARFVGCAEAFRQLASTEASWCSITAIESVISRMSVRLTVVHTNEAGRALDHMGTLLEHGSRPAPEEVARQLGMDVRALERVLVFETGSTFLQWRCLLSVRVGAQRLSRSAEQVAQIAYGLGFEHPSQFNREFRRILGLTPREFRSVLAGAAAGHQ